MSPRARWMWMAGEVVYLAVIIVGGLIVGEFWNWLGDRMWIVYGLAAAQAIAVFVSPFVRFHVHRWEVTDTAAYTQAGLWSITRQIAPLSRIQTVNVDEGAISRLFKLASVTITTASSVADIEISGLDRDVAAALASELTVKADLESGDGT
ncbi:MAG TPA: PH domain-containing protein [Aeromicrobium sp.]|nr:PH domain-containing protein [Aeromicrobium sp.]